jgi:hypothetical protein
MQLLSLCLLKGTACPARWIWRNVGSFDRSSSFKSEAQRFSEKSVRPPSCESPLKIPRHLVQLLAIRILIPKRGHDIHRSVGIGKTRCIRIGLNINAQLPTSRSVHCAVANIAECLYSTVAYRENNILGLKQVR